MKAINANSNDGLMRLKISKKTPDPTPKPIVDHVGVKYFGCILGKCSGSVL